ncbi:unnamed protein product [Choristocarpus tenellus]
MMSEQQKGITAHGQRGVISQYSRGYSRGGGYSRGRGHSQHGGVGRRKRGRHQSPLLTMTNVLTFLNVATYLMQMRFPSITSAGWKLASAITVRKQWYRLLTPVFLHGSVAHLLVNSYSLRAVGPVVEGVMGKAKFLGIYLLAGISGNVLSCIVNPRMPAVGASGAIFGMIGAWGAFLLTNYEAVGEVAADRALAGVGQTVMINLMLGMSSRQIDNMGHLGGFLGGAAVAYIIGPRLSRRLNPFTGESYLVNEQRQFASPLLRRLMGGDRSSWQQPYQQEKRWP